MAFFFGCGANASKRCYATQSERIFAQCAKTLASRGVPQKIGFMILSRLQRCKAVPCFFKVFPDHGIVHLLGIGYSQHSLLPIDAARDPSDAVDGLLHAFRTPFTVHTADRKGLDTDKCGTLFRLSLYPPLPQQPPLRLKCPTVEYTPIAPTAARIAIIITFSITSHSPASVSSASSGISARTAQSEPSLTLSFPHTAASASSSRV